MDCRGLAPATRLSGYDLIAWMVDDYIASAFMSSRKQLNLRTAILAVSFVAVFFACLSACVFEPSGSYYRPSPLSLLSAVVAGLGWRRANKKCHATGVLCLLVLSVDLAAASVVGGVVAVLQTLTADALIDWSWFRASMGGAVVGNLALPLLALMPASVAFANLDRGGLTRAHKGLEAALLFGVASAGTVVIALVILFRALCERL
jgi:hypothetical protein